MHSIFLPPGSSFIQRRSMHYVDVNQGEFMLETVYSYGYRYAFSQESINQHFTRMRLHLFFSSNG